MAFHPYFRYGTSSLDLLGIHAPVFPIQAGERQHSYLTEKNKYGVTTRKHGTTETGWRTEGIQKTIRDTIWTFWDTTLGKGYNDITVIDHRGRMLFDTSWVTWNEQWRKERGGLYSIQYDLQSPIPWTPPCWGMFPATTNSLVNHNLSGDDLTLDDGVLVDYATDNNILRKNGYALKLTGTGGGDIGAYASVGPWETAYQYNSLSLFCQFRAGPVSGDIALIKLNYGTDEFSIRIEPVDLAQNDLFGYVNNGGNTSRITRADASSPEALVDTWYDVCLSYNAVNGNMRMYYALSGTTTFTDFLYGLSDIENGILYTMSAEYYPANNPWSVLSLLREDVSGDIVANNFYIQNAMVFDGFISAQEFNTLRRLCYMWNGKTSGSHPA